MSLIASPHHDLCGMLEQLGFTVLETNDPTDAAARADLVVVPWVNRPLSGLEWCRRVREQQAELPLLVVTRSDAEANAALEAGATDVLRLPLHDAVTRARCRALLTKMNERAARPRAAFAARVLDACPDAIITTDASGLILTFNRAAELLTGHLAEEIVGNLDLGVLFDSPSEAARLDLSLRAATDHVLLNQPVRLRTAEGERVPTMVSLAALFGAGGVRDGLVGVYRDDRDNDALGERLATATAQLVQAERRGSRLMTVGAAAWELNQPLTSAMGLLELLMLRPELSADSHERLERAYNQLERLAEGVRRVAALTEAPASPDAPLT
ncbi:PAS domain-containing protein [Myxococcota bacterium]|nr:PAS domain-containing protein [Myxococcota bacterium]